MSGITTRTVVNFSISLGPYQLRLIHTFRGPVSVCPHSSQPIGKFLSIVFCLKRDAKGNFSFSEECDFETRPNYLGEGRFGLNCLIWPSFLPSGVSCVLVGKYSAAFQKTIPHFHLRRLNSDETFGYVKSIHQHILKNSIDLHSSMSETYGRKKHYFPLILKE